VQLSGGQNRRDRMSRGECVFRNSVTGRFGIVTAEFGIVTGDFGNVTDGEFVTA
jgi:hypothetical protein